MSTEFINDQWRLPNAWNGTESNVNKQSNYSMDFDTSSTHIEFATIQLNTTKSVSFWVNWNTTITGVMLGGGSGNYYPQIHQTSGVTRFYVRDTGGVDYYTYNSLLNTNQWYHVCITGNGTTAKVYLDGSLIGTMTDYTPPLKYINTENGSQYGMIGKLDAVCIFDYELSPSQITTLYGSSSTGIGNPMTLNPVAYYPLGDQDAFNGANYLVPNSSLKDFVFDFVGAGTSSSGPHINLGNNSSLSPSSEITVSIWIKTDSNSPLTASGYLDKYNSGGGYLLDFGGSSGTNKAGIKFGSSGTRITSTTVVADQKWHNILFTCDNTTLRFYVDGNEEVTASATIADLTSTEDLKIGGDGSSIYFFDGKISNFQIFNTALPATGSNSVETLYNNGSPLTSMSGFTSLQGWWKLDASATYDSSTNTWSIPDDSTNSNTGTSSGMTQANLVQSDLSFTSGYSPYALDFDGNDYITLNSNISLTGSKSVSFWFKATSIAGNNVVIGGSSTSTSNYYPYISTTSVFLRDSSGFVGLTVPAFSNNVWYHLCVVGNGTTATVYVNGQSQGTLNDKSPTINTIGAFSTGTTAFTGGLSNVSVWNAALTSAQVTEIYSEGVPQNLLNHSAVSSLVSWWQLGSNSSFSTNWTVLDEKGSNNGTSVNMTEDDIVDGVGSYANGLSSGMGGDEVIGDAPYSTANSLSVNMDVEDRVTDTPS